MKLFTISNTAKNNKKQLIFMASLALLVVLAIVSLFAGKYPLSLEKLLAGDQMQWNVFWTLRFSRTIVGIAGGFALGVTGFVYQTVFRNPLASPDIIGVSSGASAGAAAGILFLSGSIAITTFSFAGALIAVSLAIALSFLDKSGKNSSIVLAGIAIHSLAQTALMCLKLVADPESELASIEYWIMGSLNSISGHSVIANLSLCLVCIAILFVLHRQVILLSAEEGEARMLGVSVGKMRLVVLVVSTLAVSCIISMTGLISFVGLIAPHVARMITKDNGKKTMFVCGCIGGILLCGADILARCVATAELPVSIFTSMLGAPFLIFLIARRKKHI